MNLKSLENSYKTKIQIKIVLKTRIDLVCQKMRHYIYMTYNRDKSRDLNFKINN